MGVPKRRQSRARKNQRRSIVSRVGAPKLVECPQCHGLKLPHRVCPNCGFYKEREVLQVK
ncbi:MAG: 50S ribosomal protein L32 [Clostridia bacterium]|nr:50S ribosomal protein L32 [Clostridia bacterium]